MAVTLNESPAERQAAYSQWHYKLTIDDIGTGKVQKRIGYKLVDVNTGNDIVPLSSIYVPEAGGSVELNFSREVSRYLDTPVFNSQNPGIFWTIGFEPEQTRIIQLVYGDIVFNGDADPCEVVNNVNQTSEPSLFFNSAMKGPGSLDDRVFLNRKAERLYWCKGFPDYLSTANDGFLFYAVRGVNGEIAQGDIAESVFKENNIQMLFTEYIFSTDLAVEVAAIEYFIEDEYSSTYVFTDCCCDGEVQAAVMFLDPLGGRNVLPFGCLESSGIDIQQTIACLNDYKVTENIGENNMVYVTPESVFHDRITHKKGRGTFRLDTYQPSTYYNHKFFKTFYASREHHLLLRVDGTLFIIPVILTGGGTTYENEEGETNLTAELRESQSAAIQLT